jgi:hypothetical protein
VAALLGNRSVRDDQYFIRDRLILLLLEDDQQKRGVMLKSVRFPDRADFVLNN